MADAGDSVSEAIIDVVSGVLSSICDGAPEAEKMRNEANVLIGRWANDQGTFTLIEEGGPTRAAIDMFDWWQQRRAQLNSDFPLTQH